jgi:hypothetical protein
MFRKTAFILLILLSACKLKHSQSLSQEENGDIIIKIKEEGGFTGGYGPYSFHSSGFLLFRGDSLRELNDKELSMLKKQVTLIRALPAYQSSGQVIIKRSLILFSQQDTISFIWDLEDERAARHNQIYRRLSQMTN